MSHHLMLSYTMDVSSPLFAEMFGASLLLS